MLVQKLFRSAEVVDGVQYNHIGNRANRPFEGQIREHIDKALEEQAGRRIVYKGGRTLGRGTALEVFVTQLLAALVAPKADRIELFFADRVVDFPTVHFCGVEVDATLRLQIME